MRSQLDIRSQIENYNKYVFEDLGMGKQLAVVENLKKKKIFKILNNRLRDILFWLMYFGCKSVIVSKLY